MTVDPAPHLWLKVQSLAKENKADPIIYGDYDFIFRKCRPVGVYAGLQSEFPIPNSFIKHSM
jgi:hypothetical protein